MEVIRFCCLCSSGIFGYGFLHRRVYTARMRKALPLFGTMSAIMFAVLLLRLWAQRDLFLDPALRGRVRGALERTAEEEGILLSGFSIRSLTADQLIVTHRAHTRGEDTRRCFVIRFPSLSRTPCVASS